MDHRCDGTCLDNDSWRRLLLLGSLEAQKCPLDDMAFHDERGRRLLPGNSRRLVIYMLYSHRLTNPSFSGSFGGMRANDGSLSMLAQGSVSRYSLAFSDTASRFIGDLRQFPPFLFYR